MERFQNASFFHPEALPFSRATRSSASNPVRERKREENLHPLIKVADMEVTHVISAQMSWLYVVMSHVDVRGLDSKVPGG